MALLEDRHELDTDISFFCASVTDRGFVLVHNTSGSGVSLDQTAASVILGGTGVTTNLKPAGVLLNDVINYDPSKVVENSLKNETLVGSKCTLLTRGWVVTDAIATGITPVAGDIAYLAPLGKITNSSANSAPKIGRFKSGKNSNGFAKVSFELNQ